MRKQFFHTRFCICDKCIESKPTIRNEKKNLRDLVLDNIFEYDNLDIEQFIKEGIINQSDLWKKKR